MIFLPKCRALCVDLEKVHGAGKKAWRWRKRAWHGAIAKVAMGNTKLPFLHYAHFLMMIDICMQFCEDSLRVFKL